LYFTSWILIYNKAQRLIMLTDNIKKRIENATVRVANGGALGVIVPGEFILTAAHCVKYSLRGDMAVGVPYFEEIESINGNFKATPYVVEPVSDIAVLGCPDGQCFQEAEGYEEIYSKLEAVSLCTREYEIDKPFDAYIYTHENTWLEVKAVCQEPLWQWIHAGTITLKHEKELKAGTSGGPIVNDLGELLGVVSQGQFSGKHAWACKALPVWVVKGITQPYPIT